MNKEIRKEIVSWLKDYENNAEHDADFTIALKDDAYNIFRKLIDKK